MPAQNIRFSELDHEQMQHLLGRNHVGRLAYCIDNRVDVRPLHYVLDEPWIWGRTSYSETIDRLQRNWWVALEVDEVEGTFDWRSVVVRGGFYPLSPDAPSDRPYLERAVAALRSFLPETLGPDDPVPERSIVFGIALQEVTGRMATTQP